MKFIWESSNIVAGVRVKCYSSSLMIVYNDSDSKYYTVNLDTGNMSRPFTPKDMAEMLNEKRSNTSLLIMNNQERLRASFKWKFCRFMWVNLRDLSSWFGKRMIKMSKEADHE